MQQKMQRSGVGVGKGASTLLLAGGCASAMLRAEQSSLQPGLRRLKRGGAGGGGACVCPPPWAVGARCGRG